MQRQDFRFFHPLRVRYSEVDAQKVVFNAHYLTYFDVALTEFLRDLGYDYHGLVERQRLDFHLVKSTVEYLAPIHFDDELEIGVRAARIGNSSLTWELAIFRHNEKTCLSRGDVVWVCAAVGSHRSHPLPADLRALLATP